MTDVCYLLACVLEDSEAFRFFMDGGAASMPSKQANKTLTQSRIALKCDNPRLTRDMLIGLYIKI